MVTSSQRVQLAQAQHSSSKYLGSFLAIISFILWGITPLFYQLLPNASTLDLLAQRLFWSLPILFIARLFLKDRTKLNILFKDKKSFFLCLLTGLMMTISWATFTYALTHGQVLSASLGYFITPLVSISFALIIFKDKLSQLQKIAVVLAIIGLSYQILHYGQLPKLALMMGCAFALYGLIRKFIRYDVITALTLETLWLYPLAIIITIYLHMHGGSVLTRANFSVCLFYILSAPVTLLPLFFFAASVKKTSLIVIGLAQYIEPTCQFLLAVFLFHEALDTTKAISFLFIWLGLLLCMIEIIFHHFRYKRRTIKTNKI